MLLLDVSTRSFRNLREARIELGRRTTVLFGPNGQGKTNFLEACHLLCTLRPLRAQKLAELVRIGSEESALVRGRFELSGGLRDVEVEVGREGRSARVDGKTVRDPDELFGGLATVAFTPDDLSVVKGGPEGRRKLLDRAAQNRHPSHLADSREYLRALRARNELLRQDAPPDLLASFDEPLARLGANVRRRREQVLEEIRPHAQQAFAEVARGEAPLELVYLAAGRDSDGLAGAGRRLRIGCSTPCAGAFLAIASAGTRASGRMRTIWGCRSARGRHGSTPARVNRGPSSSRSRSGRSRT